MKKLGMVAVLFALTMASGCADADRARLQRGVDWAKARLMEVERNPLAAASFDDIMEQGGDVMIYLSASMPDDPDLPNFTSGAPTKPWTVFIKHGPGTNEFIIEGYGTNLTKAIISDHVTVVMYHRP